MSTASWRFTDQGDPGHRSEYCIGWPLSTAFVVLRAFAKAIAASRATNTVKDFTAGNFITVIYPCSSADQWDASPPALKLATGLSVKL